MKRFRIGFSFAPAVSFASVGLAAMPYFACLLFYEGDIRPGGLLEWMLVPRGMRCISNDVGLNPAKAFYVAGDLEGKYMLTYRSGGSNGHELWEHIERVAERKKWVFVGYSHGDTGQSMSFLVDQLDVAFYEKDGGIVMSVRHSM